MIEQNTATAEIEQSGNDQNQAAEIEQPGSDQNQAAGNESEPILIAYDEQGYRDKKAAYQSIAQIVQQVIVMYNGLGLPALTDPELQKLLNDPVDLIFDKMTGGQPVSIIGLQVCKHKAIDLLIKPAGYVELIERITVLKGSGFIAPYSDLSVRLNDIGKNFELTKNGKVKIRSNADEALQRQFKTYAKSERAKKMLAFVNAVIQTATELGLKEYFERNPNGIGYVVKNIIDGGDGKPLTLNTAKLIKFNEPEFSGYSF